MNPSLLRYFDSAASTPLDPRVEQVMKDNLHLHANNNSKHHAGYLAQKVIDEGLKTIADVLNVNWEQLCIMYSGTDANRRFLWECEKLFGKEKIYGSAVEHSSISDEILAKNTFDPLTFQGLPDEAQVIALMGANSETGTIYPAQKLREQFPAALILRDYSQSFAKGVVPDLENSDAAVFTPQKIYGPKHIGILYLKNPEKFPALSKDTHTKSPYLLAGAAESFKIWKEQFTKNKDQILKWDQKIYNFIADNIPDHKFHEVPGKERCVGLISVSFEGVRGSEIMAKLSSEEQICVSTGSACTTDMMTATPVMQYLEPDPTWQHPIRISLHKFLNDQSVDDFCEILEHYVTELRK